MRLLRQTQQLFFHAILPVFAVVGVVSYFSLRWAFNHETDEILVGVRADIEAFVQAHDTLPVFFQTVDDRLDAEPMPQKNLEDFPDHVFSDTLLYNKFENELEPFRRLRFPVMMRGQVWLVSVSQSTVEHEDLAWTVALLLVVMLVSLFLVMLWVNRRVSQQVWKPFFETLEKMRGFRLNDPAPLHLAPAPVEEFRELNETLETFAEQVRQDYRTVKQFTENASHELQTPLAIIQSKVEMLLQDETLNEVQAQQLNIIAQSTRRMARLNQSLLVLSKIENNQFSEQKPVALKPLLERKLAWLEDFITEKRLTVEASLVEKTLQINPFLAETLVTNVLANAVKHNIEDGFLCVFLNEKCLVVENSAARPEGPVADLTARFARGNHQSEGLGLGLAIVSEICGQENLNIEISFEQGVWMLEIEFSNSK